jgi:sulfatase maturation enzyme AslB (radical SAM superfamily)
MDKYRKAFSEKVKPQMNHDTGEYKVEPFRDAQNALRRATFVKTEREQFFNDAYGEILSDLFVTWLKSEPHAVKEREFLYASAMALGEVKARMINIETYGNNMKFIAQEGANKVDTDE